MWLLLPRATQLSLIVGATVLLLWALGTAAEFATGAAVSQFKLISLLVFLLGTVLVSVLNLCWRPVWARFPVLGRAFFPDLNGTWRGTLQTTWKDADGVSPGPIQSTIWVRQSLFTIHVQQQTNESDSWSQRVFPEAHPGSERFGLWYSYSNQPKAAVSHRSTYHDGVARLDFSRSGGVDRLMGQYFTARRTNGDISVERVSPNVIQT